MKKITSVQNWYKTPGLLSNKLFTKHISGSRLSFFFSAAVCMAALTSCSKQTMNDNQSDKVAALTNQRLNTNADFSTWYDGLEFQTTRELQQARAATARYKNIENAKKDGYTNINVDVENMGHHYMKPGLVDATFDIRHPEILVYHETADGSMELGAVEYALPLSQPRPEGFSGSADVWDGNTGFQLWLLHAWVWSYNPNGVFNPLNPSVHIH